MEWQTVTTQSAHSLAVVAVTTLGMVLSANLLVGSSSAQWYFVICVE